MDGQMSVKSSIFKHNPDTINTINIMCIVSGKGKCLFRGIKPDLEKYRRITGSPAAHRYAVQAPIAAKYLQKDKF